MIEQQTTVRYEERDINIRDVLLIAFGVLACTIIIILALYLPYAYMRHLKAQQSPPTSPVQRRVFQLPPEPRIQQSPALDYETMFHQSQWDLHHYQWIDKPKGIVAIPIDRAMDIVAKRGIPASTEPPSNFYKPEQGDRLTGFEERAEPQP